VGFPVAILVVPGNRIEIIAALLYTSLEVCSLPTEALFERGFYLLQLGDTGYMVTMDTEVPILGGLPR
jgi:hypothetical protein